MSNEKKSLTHLHVNVTDKVTVNLEGHTLEQIFFNNFSEALQYCSIFDHCDPAHGSMTATPEKAAQIIDEMPNERDKILFLVQWVSYKLYANNSNLT